MKTIYERKGKKIKNLEENTTEVYKSINAAKRKSTQIQLSTDGAIGRGCLMLG